MRKFNFVEIYLILLLSFLGSFLIGVFDTLSGGSCGNIPCIWVGLLSGEIMMILACTVLIGMEVLDDD